MKLDILVEKEEKKPGTYVGAKFTPETIARLKKFTKDNNIPNKLKSSEFHTTIIYSRKHVPDLDMNEKLEVKWIGKPEKLEIFDTKDGPKALVLLYSCPEQKALHKKILDTTVATYDYPEYNMHISLSYDIGDADEDELKKLSLKKIGDIVIDRLFSEDIED